MDEEKRALRRRLKAVEQRLTPEERRASDAALFAGFYRILRDRRPQRVGLFWGMGAEPDTAPLAMQLHDRGIRVALPRCLPGGQMEFRRYDPARALVRHPYGMWEPDGDSPLVLPEELELLLVPALCYDRQRMRLGRGGGFYDRYLAHYPGYTVGLCRACLLQERVPREEHDRRVDAVVTEDRVL